MPPELAFAAVSVLTLLGGAVAVGAPSLFRSALGLMISLLGVAGLFLLQRAEFLAVVQVLIYVGGVSVLIVFAILLTERSGPMQVSLNRAAPVAAVIGTALALGLALVVWQSGLAPDAPPAGVSASDLGVGFLNAFLIPFEAVSLLLLVALVGALVIAKEER